MRRLKTLVPCVAMLLLCACGSLSLSGSGSAEDEGPAVRDAAGNIQKTKGYVFLYNKNAPKQFVMPPVPAGAARLYGDLYSTTREGNQNFTWKVKSLMYPDTERDEAWFYVDFVPATGEILNAGAYATGWNRNTVYLGFFEKYRGSFGNITDKGFELQIAGVSYGSGVWQGEGGYWEYPAVILVRGKGNLLKKKNGVRLPFTYEILEVAGEAGRINISGGNTGEITEEFEIETLTTDKLVDKGKGTAVLSK